MSDYSFIIGNGIVILLMVIGLGFFGGAQDLTSEDIIIGDAEKLVETGEVENVSQVDFDTNKLTPRFDFSSLTEFQGTVQGYTWSGNGTNGSLTYDVSGEDEIVIVSKNPGFFSDKMFVKVRGVDNNESFEDRLNLNSDENLIALDSSVFNYQVNEIEIFITAQDSELLGFKETTLTIQDAINVRNIQETQTDVQTSFFDRLNNYLGAIGITINSTFAVFIAWIEFIWIIPGLVGWFLKGYIAILLAYFVIDQIYPF